MRWACWLVFLCFCWCFSSDVFGGGSGLNVLVVVNKNSTNSVQLGNYYREARQIPPQNVVNINWAGGNIEWTLSDFQTVLLNPVLAAVATRGLTNQIDYLVLSMDIPYRVTSASPAGGNSTTSALYYGFKPDDAAPGPGLPASCSLPAASSNSYAGSEAIFRFARPGTATTNAFLAMLLTSSNLSQALANVDRGVASDSTFPQQTVVLGKNPTDGARNIRYQLFDDAIFNTRLRGGYQMVRTSADATVAFSNLLGYQNGFQGFPTYWAGATFVPGAMADDLTSFGGRFFEVYDHTTALQFLIAGATASYGTVVEPCAYLAKFPSPMDYFYQARGFTIGEAYYQSITNPYQGVLVGEPLAAPFASPPSGTWSGAANLWTLAGTTNLVFQGAAQSVANPLQRVDLFVDGTFYQALTNIPPRTNNILSVTLRGQTVNYTVTNGTIKATAAGLASALNLVSSQTRCQAYAHGDRVELQSTDLATAGSQVALSANSAKGSAAALTTFITASGPGLVDSVAQGTRTFGISGTPANMDYLQLVITGTNGIQTSLNVTNTTGSMTTLQMVQQLVAAVNGTLTGAEGIHGDDVTPGNTVEFNLYANSAGWSAAQVQVDLNGSSRFTLNPSNAQKLDQNLSALRPRGHLYISSGVTSLPLAFALDPTRLPDGFHELTAVLYEGSHVWAQKRVSQNVLVTNSTLSATFTGSAGPTNVSSALQFSMVANTANISKIELFSTGGLLTNVLGQSSASFSIPGSILGIGLHPVYAVLTGTNGKQYRTETKWLRLLGQEPAFSITMSGPPPVLSWPATAGRSYDVLATTNLSLPFKVIATVVPSNSTVVWHETNVADQRFYRVRAAN